MASEVQAASPRRTESRLPALDLLRGTAALVVAIGHFFIYGNTRAIAMEPIPVLAVEVFFVLSGYVLAPQIMYCVKALQAGALWIFLVRRWMRTVPPYWIALLAMSALYGEIGTRDFLRYAFYVQNLFNLANSVDYYSIAWSLSVEEWFYLTFPALCIVAAIAMARSGDPQRRATISVVLVGVLFIVACEVLRLLASSTEADTFGGIRRVVIYRLDSIAIGVLLYLIARARTFSTKYCVPLFAATALITFALSTHLTTGFGAQVIFPFLSSAFGVTALLCALSLNGHLSLGVSKFASWFASISYSLYLFHLVMLLIVMRILVNAPLAIQLIVFLALCLVFCTLFYSFVETPILAARPSFKKARSPLATSTEMPHG